MGLNLNQPTNLIEHPSTQRFEASSPILTSPDEQASSQTRSHIYSDTPPVIRWWLRLCVLTICVKLLVCLGINLVAIWLIPKLPEGWRQSMDSWRRTF